MNDGEAGRITTTGPPSSHVAKPRTNKQCSFLMYEKGHSLLGSFVLKFVMSLRFLLLVLGCPHQE